MKAIKFLLATAAMLAFALATFAEPDGRPIYQPTDILSSYIVSGGATSNSVGAVFFCGKQQNVPIAFVSTGIVTNQVSISVSVDGTTYNTNHFVISWTNATAPFVLLTNLPVQGYGYIRLDRFADTGNRGCTNTVTVASKISSP